jgi:hypothetical protein
MSRCYTKFRAVRATVYSVRCTVYVETPVVETADNLITVLSGTGSLAQLHEEQGRLHHAAKMYQQTIRVVEKQAKDRSHPGRPLPIAGWAYLGLAEILRG